MSTMLYVSSDHPLNAIVLAILREVDRLAGEIKLDYFVAGATARDILLHNVYGLSTGRATRDVDFAITVESWAQFETVKTRLTAGGRFNASTRVDQRLYYRPAGGELGYPLDIIPFGGVEQPPNMVAWPPDMKVLINVAGYEETLAAAVPVQVDHNLAVRVASLPGLVVLKLFAWSDRGQESSKDAEDLVTLFRNYANAGNMDRLYDSEIGLLENVGFDLELAAPRLLGQDVQKMATPQTLGKIQTLLSEGKTANRLVTHMAKTLRGVDDPVIAAEQLLDQFKEGLNGK